MYRFVESIKLEDGVFYRLKLHQERINIAFADCFPSEEPINVFQILNQYSIPQKGIFKTRILYDSDFQSIEFIPYTKREIISLQLVDTEMESFRYKLEDRTGFNIAFAKRGECDDVLLVRNGLLTDTSYSNIALFDGKQWFTPKSPLLFGVNRAQLIDQGKLIEKNISVNELVNFQRIRLFNAMIEFGQIDLDVSGIHQ